MDEHPISGSPSPDEIMANFDFGEIEGPKEGLEGFPTEVRENVEGLMFLGYLEDSFEFCGHQFVIHTLRGDEELLAGLITKDFVNTMSAEKAWVWALVSLCLAVVDGDPDFCPRISKSDRDYARQRFQYCTKKWLWPLAVHIHNKYAALLTKQNEAMEAMEDLSQGNPTTFTPSVEFSKEEGASEEPPVEEIMDYLDGADQDPSNPDSSSSSSSEN
jgi:hypothetical protein